MNYKKMINMYNLEQKKRKFEDVSLLFTILFTSFIAVGLFLFIVTYETNNIFGVIFSLCILFSGLFSQGITIITMFFSIKIQNKIGDNSV